MENAGIRILVVEAESAGPNRIKDRLTNFGYSRSETVGPETSIREIESHSPDAAIIGPSLTPEQCHDVIRKLKIVDILMPIFVSREPESQEEKKGFGNFHGIAHLAPEFDGEVFSTNIQDALKGRNDHGNAPDLPILIGQSPQMKVIRDRIYSVSDKDVTILITGETGTGKEIIARAIHYFSHRSSGPLIKISCGNLPDQLLESEIFGFQKGAFTDAHRNKPGRLELADRGTLFLDEIGDLSLFLQVKFLQIFEDKSFSRLGAVEERMVDARVLAATNFDLWKKVKQGEFRRDLFYRLNVVHIRTAPLRERMEDIPILVDHFLNKYCSLLRREPMELSKGTLERFYSYPWPGNVRELENLVKRAIVLRNWDFVAQEIRPAESMPEHSDSTPESVLKFLRDPDPIAESLRNGKSTLKEITASYVSAIERKTILSALEAVRWNKRKAAEILGVSYKTVCNRIKDLKIGTE